MLIFDGQIVVSGLRAHFVYSFFFLYLSIARLKCKLHFLMKFLRGAWKFVRTVQDNAIFTSDSCSSLVLCDVYINIDN